MPHNEVESHQIRKYADGGASVHLLTERRCSVSIKGEVLWDDSFREMMNVVHASLSHSSGQCPYEIGRHSVAGSETRKR